MTSLAIISYFKDEAHILNEWILHHLNFGISHIYLVDNGSNDSYKELLVNYSQEVTVFVGPDVSQIRAYQEVYKVVQNKHDWVIFLDLDEFLYIKNDDRNICKFLATIDDNIMALQVGWTMFMPNRLFQPKSVIQECTTACLKDEVAWLPFKTIFRTRIDVGDVGIHRPKKMATMDRQIFRPEDGILQINHYRFQSYEYLLGVKSKRGAGTHSEAYTLQNIRKLMDQYLNSTLCHNDDLARLSSELICTLNKMPQSRPATHIYQSDCWTQVLFNFVDENIDLDPEGLYHYILSIIDVKD